MPVGATTTAYYTAARRWDREDGRIPDPITVSITRTVDLDRSREVAAWARAGQDLLAEQPGYLGSGWVRSEPDGPQWHMLFRYSEHQERRTGIDGWFDEPSTVETIRAGAGAHADRDLRRLPVSTRALRPWLQPHARRD